MDPNANLAEQLRIASRLNNGTHFDADAARLAELVEALNDWITMGGFLPKEWASQ